MRNWQVNQIKHEKKQDGVKIKAESGEKTTKMYENVQWLCFFFFFFLFLKMDFV